MNLLFVAFIYLIRLLYSRASLWQVLEANRLNILNWRRRFFICWLNVERTRGKLQRDCVDSVAWKLVERHNEHVLAEYRTCGIVPVEQSFWQLVWACLCVHTVEFERRGKQKETKNFLNLLKIVSEY